MFRLDPRERIGAAELMGGNDAAFQKVLRAHPFLRPVKWQRIYKRIERVSRLAPSLPFVISSSIRHVQAPYVPIGADPTLGWHYEGIPFEKDIPGLNLVWPPPHQQHDGRRRFEPEREEDDYNYQEGVLEVPTKVTAIQSKKVYRKTPRPVLRPAVFDEEPESEEFASGGNG